MPAWSGPGIHGARSRRMRCQRVRISISVWFNMWPMCRRPVTLGGGRRMVNFRVPSCVFSGVGTSKRRSLTQYSAQRSSMTDGSYALGRSFVSSGLLDCSLMDALRVALSFEVLGPSFEVPWAASDATHYRTRSFMRRLLLAVGLLLVSALPALAKGTEDRASIGNDITIAEGQTAGDVACLFCAVHAP